MFSYGNSVGSHIDQLCVSCTKQRNASKSPNSIFRCVFIESSVISHHLLKYDYYYLSNLRFSVRLFVGDISLKTGTQCHTPHINHKP